MARHVDHAKRELDITRAALRIISTQGPKALTLRRLAQELGGSQTLVTHFFANRSELFRAVTDRLIATYDDDVAAREALAGDPAERLRLLVEWMLPLQVDAQLLERARVMLVSHQEEDASVRHFFEAMENKMRQLLYDHVVAVTPKDQVEVLVDVLRVTINGIVLSSAEHPGEWPAERQLRLINRQLEALELDRPPPVGR